MNERIRELAFQAMSINQKVSDDSFFVEVSKLKEFEKFAELLLGNVLDITDAHTEVFQTDRDQALIEHIKQSVKQHFGVGS